MRALRRALERDKTDDDETDDDMEHYSEVVPAPMTKRSVQMKELMEERRNESRAMRRMILIMRAAHSADTDDYNATADDYNAEVDECHAEADEYNVETGEYYVEVDFDNGEADEYQNGVGSDNIDTDEHYAATGEYYGGDDEYHADADKYYADDAYYVDTVSAVDVNADVDDYNGDDFQNGNVDSVNGDTDEDYTDTDTDDNGDFGDDYEDTDSDNGDVGGDLEDAENGDVDDCDGDNDYYNGDVDDYDTDYNGGDDEYDADYYRVDAGDEVVTDMCLNCDKPGHVWRQCRDELTEDLWRKVRKKVKMEKKKNERRKWKRNRALWLAAETCNEVGVTFDTHKGHGGEAHLDDSGQVNDVLDPGFHQPVTGQPMVELKWNCKTTVGRGPQSVRRRRTVAKLEVRDADTGTVELSQRDRCHVSTHIMDFTARGSRQPVHESKSATLTRFLSNLGQYLRSAPQLSLAPQLSSENAFYALDTAATNDERDKVRTVNAVGKARTKMNRRKERIEMETGSHSSQTPQNGVSGDVEFNARQRWRSSRQTSTLDSQRTSEDVSHDLETAAVRSEHWNVCALIAVTNTHSTDCTLGGAFLDPVLTGTRKQTGGNELAANWRKQTDSSWKLAFAFLRMVWEIF